VVTHVCQALVVSERRACKVLRQTRATQRYVSHVESEEEKLVNRIAELATQYGRYGYRRITALLRQEGWQVNHKHVANLEKGRIEGATETAKKEATLAK